jgi:hypothetical protein
MRSLAFCALALVSCTNFGKFMFADGGGGDMSGAGDLGGMADLGACPNPIGRYTATNQQGDCSDFNDKANTCVGITPTACMFHVSSNPLQPPPAVNGGITLDPTGHFGPGTLILGTTSRTNCMGQFDPVANTITIVCDAGTGTMCTILLTRAAIVCG